MGDENQFVFFGVKPCLFLKWTFFFCFSRDGCNPLRDKFYNSATWAFKELPSKQTQEAGELPFSIRRIRFKKAYFPNIPNTRCFFLGRLSILAYIESPPQKKTPQRKTTLVATILFSTQKNPSQSFLSSDISSKETSPDSSERGGWSATQKNTKNIQENSAIFFSLQANRFQKDQIFPPRKSHEIFFRALPQGGAQKQLFLLMWKNSTCRLLEVIYNPSIPI